ncbi:hypothetical protein [Streptomyces sp. NPDC093514]|uniref:hypothetical protein n=1 Tax=Streptomyces sp. NPDC093514 TaxID=3366039 RepID=UPI00380A99A4
MADHRVAEEARKALLVAAAIVSLVIQEWTTAILPIVLTLLNAVPADGRPVEAGALQTDASAPTGESVPAAKGTGPAFTLVARRSKAA